MGCAGLPPWSPKLRARGSTLRHSTFFSVNLSRPVYKLASTKANGVTMAAVLPAPSTVAAVIMPDLLAREDAIKFLTSECVEPRIDAAQATEVWERCHRQREELPERNVAAPGPLPLNPEERAAADAFLHRFRQAKAANILDVIKFDPRRCVVWQHAIITERSDTYAGNMAVPQARLQHCLGAHANPGGQVPIISRPNDIRARVPHAEYMFNFLNPQGFQIQELAKHISVTAFDNRLLLYAGYHRSFAVMTSEYPDGMDRSLIAVLTSDGDAVLSPQSPNQGVREIVRGLRPPLFEDFLDERFCMRVRLRKKRCELWIQGQIKWFDDDA